jgi:hypothetical protein
MIHLPLGAEQGDQDTMGVIDQGNTVKIIATGEQGVVVGPSSSGGFKYHHAGSGRMNIAVYSVLLDSGEVRQYIGAAIELVA